MRAFRGPIPNALPDDDDDEYADPDLIEPVFIPADDVLVDEDEEDDLVFPEHVNVGHIGVFHNNGTVQIIDLEDLSGDEEEENEDDELLSGGEPDDDWSGPGEGWEDPDTDDSPGGMLEFDDEQEDEGTEEQSESVRGQGVQVGIGTIPQAAFSDDLTVSSLDGPSDADDVVQQRSDANGKCTPEEADADSNWDTPTLSPIAPRQDSEPLSESDPEPVEEAVEKSVHGLKRKHSSGSDTSLKVDEQMSSLSSTEGDDDPYSNPFAEEATEEDAIRGDRIGNTTYSERHVLKILMKWIQDLPKYSTHSVKPEDVDDNEETQDETETTKLEKDFKKDMQLLWDMSSEPDVMKYLVEKDIFAMILNSLLSSTCDRLTEMTLGILANILSDTEILITFEKVNEEFDLVGHVVSIGCTSAHVPILFQVVAVLRRVAWCIKNVKQEGVTLFKPLNSPDFGAAVTFLLNGSTNVLLIKDLVMLIFSLLETFIPGDDGEETSPCINPDYKVFASETFVAGLCEALKEIMKTPEGEDGMEGLIDDSQIPSHIQTAIRCGLGSLCYIQKVPEGLVAIKNEKIAIIEFLIQFFKDFTLITETLENDKALEYFIAGLNLLAFCHTEFPELQTDAAVYPVVAGRKLIENEEKNRGLKSEREISYDYCTDGPNLIISTAIVTHEHVGILGDKFGAEVVQKAISQSKQHDLVITRKFLKFIEQVTHDYRQRHNNSVGTAPKVPEDPKN